MPSIREDFEDEKFYFKQDRAPLYYHHDVRSFLDETLPNRWIGRRGFIEHPLHSPDHTPLDYAMKLATAAELRATIEHECTQIPRG